MYKAYSLIFYWIFEKTLLKTQDLLTCGLWHILGERTFTAETRKVYIWFHIFIVHTDININSISQNKLSSILRLMKVSTNDSGNIFQYRYVFPNVSHSFH